MVALDDGLAGRTEHKINKLARPASRLAAAHQKKWLGEKIGLIFQVLNDRQLICDLAPLRIQGVAEQRWLGNDRAIYLSLLVNSLEAVRANGRPETETARLVYDFQRGELFVFSSAPLWRSPSGEERWLNEEEFNAVLARYQ